MKKRITNPLEKRRRNNRKTQAQVAEFLGITQSQYSRLENAECSPEPYLAKLYHEKKPDHIYLNIKGWFPNHIAQEAIDYLTEHMEAEVRKEQSAAQQEA